MARFDPNTFPDRLAFEAAARRIRAEELARLFGAAVAWLEGRQQKIARYLGTFAPAFGALTFPASPPRPTR
jgi:hypothetical protein